MGPWNSTIIGLVLAGVLACDGGETPEVNNEQPSNPSTTEAEVDIGDVLAVVNRANVGSTAF